MAEELSVCSQCLKVRCSCIRRSRFGPVDSAWAAPLGRHAWMSEPLPQWELPTKVDHALEGQRAYRALLSEAVAVLERSRVDAVEDCLLDFTRLKLGLEELRDLHEQVATTLLAIQQTMLNSLRSLGEEATHEAATGHRD